MPRPRRLQVKQSLLICAAIGLPLAHSLVPGRPSIPRIHRRPPRPSSPSSSSRSSSAPRMMSSSPPSDSSSPRTVVIAGAGVVGTSAAYYLAANHGVRSVVVDPTGTVAPAASGKAGGFLALDWNDHSPVGRLARRSFDLHAELAGDGTLGAERIMYRRLTCAAVSVDPAAARRRPGGKKLAGVEWAEDDDGGDDRSSVLGSRDLGDESTIAQVHPKMLCDALWAEASKSAADGGVGSELVVGEVVSAVYDVKEEDRIVGARLSDGSTVAADAVLYACGPWTEFGNLMTGVKYHSAVIPTPRVLTQSVFFDGCGDPEVYPRPDSTAYCTGFPDPPVRVTERPGREEVRPEAVDRIVTAVRAASGRDGALGADPAVEQACYLPTTPDGLPLMGRVPGEQGACYVAAGHGCWGILLGPATGEAMAELIVSGRSSKVDLRPFDPSRFDRLIG